MLLSNSQLMRNADDTAIHENGIPSTLLMRNAAGRLAAAAAACAGENRRAVVFCGSGNNGGDGVASAMLLLRRGFHVRAVLTGRRESMTEDTREMERRLIEVGGALEDFDPEAPALLEDIKKAGVLVDAIFGIGLNKPVRGRALDAIALMNGALAPTVSADIPSGVEADTGRILGQAVRAKRTVTFSMAKPGHFVEPGCVCTGELEIADIGIPAELLKNCACGVHAVADGEIWLPRRNPVSHKGDYGKLLIAAGSVGYTGAPCLCARAALRSGAGLVYLGVPEPIYGITAVKNDEAMPFPLPSDGKGLAISAKYALLEKLRVCDVCATGPGLGRGEGAVETVRAIVEHGDKPTVIDADGLYALSLDMELLKKAGVPLVLTPHEAEFKRMGGSLSGDRCKDAAEFARKYNCTLVLKGHRTITAFPDGDAYVTTHGNAGMAKGGTGDVLTGVIASMLCQLPFKRAVITAVYLHALAGDICRDRQGEYAMTAGDMIEALSPASSKIIRRE